MAHDIEIRFKCRALFEVMDKSLSQISEQEGVGVSTLSDWKNDDREEYGGIWVKGCKAKNVAAAAKKLKEELEATSIYDDVKKRIKEFSVVKGDTLDINSIKIDNKDIQADIETEVTLLATIAPDWFDNKLFRNALYSNMLIERNMRKNPDKVKQADLKMSSETIRMAKESRFGKTPDTIIFNNNGNYTNEELEKMSVEDLEKLYLAEQKKLAEAKTITIKHDTQHDT